MEPTYTKLGRYHSRAPDCPLPVSYIDPQNTCFRQHIITTLKHVRLRTVLLAHAMPPKLSLVSPLFEPTLAIWMSAHSDRKLRYRCCTLRLSRQKRLDVQSPCHVFFIQTISYPAISGQSQHPPVAILSFRITFMRPRECFSSISTYGFNEVFSQSKTYESPSARCFLQVGRGRNGPECSSPVDSDVVASSSRKS